MGCAKDEDKACKVVNTVLSVEQMSVFSHLHLVPDT